MQSLYTDGKYLETTQTWHAEDSPWKARQIKKIIDKNQIQPNSIAEIGCGAGSILNELSKQNDLQSVRFEGYDISPQAIAIAKTLENDRLSFFQGNLLSEVNNKYFDILLIVDVIEHVPDYMGFVEKCKTKATYKIFHIPLDIHVHSVVCNFLTGKRYTVGHIQYFTADSAISTLRDTGHDIIDYIYTDGAFGVFKEHSSLKRAIGNVLRWVFAKFSVPISARLLGGYSLLVVTK